MPGPSREVAAKAARIPLFFVENLGQVSAGSSYYVAGRDSTIEFASGGLTYRIRERRPGSPERPKVNGLALSTSEPGRAHDLHLDFAGANPHVRLEPAGALPTNVSTFVGDRETWRTNLATYTVSVR